MAMENLWRSFGKNVKPAFCLLELNFSWPKFAKMQKHVDAWANVSFDSAHLRCEICELDNKKHQQVKNVAPVLKS